MSTEKRVSSLSPEKQALLAQLLQQRRTTGEQHAGHAIAPRADQSNYPLSYAQRRLWFLHQMDPDSTLYTIPAALRVRGPLDVAALHGALNDVVDRHEVLRASFSTADGTPRQHVATHVSLPLPLLDLSSLAPDEREARALQQALALQSEPFDLSKPPLLRAHLLRLGAEEHLLLLTVHHIVFDGWSTAVFFQDLSAAYRRRRQGGDSSPPPPPLQYADFAAWQAQYLQAERLEQQLAYWQAQLDGAPPLLEMATDFPRPSRPRHRGGHVSFVLDEELTGRSRTLSRRENASLFMTLLAAFQAVLYRYTGQDDICVGTPIANRTHAAWESLIGFFVNTLIVRGDLSATPSFRQLLQRIRQTTLDAYAHQDFPFEMLVEKLQPDRVRNHAPLFQVMFDLQNSPRQELRIADLHFEPLDLPRNSAKFDLLLSLEDDGDCLQGTLEYDADLFRPDTVERLVGHFRTLLTGAVAQPDTCIDDLPLLTPAEREQVLVDWNGDRRPYPAESTLQAQFAAQAARTPDATALFYEGQSVTFAELERRANRLAHLLRRRGVGPDTIVGLGIPRSCEMLVGLLAILKAGGAYLPLDPAYPPERLAYMLRDSHAPLLLTVERLRDHWPEDGTEILSVDGDWDAAAALPETAPEVESGPHHLAYVIYTSGSTGRPKGVMIEQRGALNLMSGLERLIYEPAGAHSWRISLNAPLSFDASVQQIVMLLRGHALYVIPQEIRADGPALVDYVRRHRLHLLDCVPSQLKVMIDAGLLDPDAPWSLRACLPGGEAIDEETWAILAAAPRTAFYNMYGPTECAVDATVATVSGAGPRPNIGRPIPNNRAYVLDPRGKLLPAGVPGELHLGGAGVGRGYLHRPDLTAERFVPDPFNTAPNARLYKTGDLARFLPDGRLEFLGRIDHQVKVRGFRIELGEIESALRIHPAVQEAVVIARTAHDDGNGSRLLVAYWLPDPSAPRPTTAELRDAIRRQLPDYMVPSAYVRLEALPLTPNGKIDRRALPAPDWSSAGDTYQAPRTVEEELLAAIFAAVLQLERVGIRDSFFDLGGHSLLATRVISRIRQTFDVDLPLRALFDRPTVAGLARAIRQTDRVVSRPLTRRAGDDIPISHAQQRLWFLDHLQPDDPLYNIALAARLEGELSVPALQESLRQIVDRHEVLRTTYPSRRGEPRPTLHDAANLSLPVDDLSALPPAEREKAWHQQVQAESRRPFDLAHGPLLRARLLRLGDREHVLLLVLHHIVADGWSVDVLLDELATLYPALRTGRDPALPPLPLQYADYAAWQRDQLAGPLRDRQLDFWRETLAGAPPLLELPTDHPRPAVQSFRGALHHFTVPPDLLAAVDRLAREENGTRFMALLAAYQALLSRYSRQEEVMVGTPVANRQQIETEPLVGFFANTLVLRGDLGNDPSFRKLLEQTRRTVLAAHAHQDVPFEMVVDAVQPERDLSHAPLFQAMLVLQNGPPAPVTLPDLTLTPLPVDTGTAKFDLTLNLVEGDAGLLADLEYSTDLFDPETVAQLGTHFVRLLRAMLAEPDRPVSQHPILTDAERHQLLRQWNQTAAPYPSACAHDLFTAAAREHPRTAAVDFLGRRITYGELNARANQLARYLQKIGVGPETVVGLCVERSPRLLLGILGILKAGAAYLPLDPAYPPQRLGFMLQDAGLRTLITESAVLPALPPHAATVITLDDDWPQIAAESSEAPLIIGSPADLAYAIYTSGSTGRPKAALLEHAGLVNFIQAYIQELQMSSDRRTLQFASMAFDASVAEIFTALLSGATLCLAPRETILSAPDLAGFIDRQQVDFAILPPAMLHSLALLQARLPALRTLVTVGEACPPPVVAYWAPHRRLYNGYGPTEATVGPTLHRIRPAEAEQGPIPIGRPILNTRAYVLDPHGEPVPIGVPGELYVGGVGVARGYLNRPELTAERFLPDPFSPEPWARMYRTGDLVKYRRDGVLIFLGRLDQQVKIRGFRVEPGEIESVLLTHPAVEAVAVRQWKGGSGTRLAAYLATAGDPPPNIGQLRKFISRRLPDYMVPASFTFLERLPLTPSGKVDRRALPPPDSSRPDIGAPFVAPAGAAEQTLAAIWQEVLGVDQVGSNDNFFELGGDSILTIQVVARAAEAGWRITPRQLFQLPTVAGLAHAAERTSPEQSRTQQEPVTGPVPLTPIQRWFLQQQKQAPAAARNHWNQAVLLEVPAGLDPVLLRAATGYLLRHHDALRLRIRREADTWRQEQAAPDEQIPFDHINLSDVHGEARAVALEEESARLHQSLDLGHGPLLRVAYFDYGESTPGRLLLVVHHMAVDAVSWRILLPDFHTLYQQLLAERRPQLPPKSIAFQTWAGYLEEQARAPEVEEQVGYWRSVLRHPPALPLAPADEPPREAKMISLTVTLDREATEQMVHAVPAAYHSGMDHALLSGLVRALAPWSGGRSLLVDLENHGRHAPESMDLSRTVGWFTTLYPVRLEIPAGADPAAALQAVKEQLRQVPDHGLGFGLLRHLHHDAPLDDLPAPAISFNYLGQISSEGIDGWLPASEAVGPERADDAICSHPLQINGALVNGRLRFTWSYALAAIDADTVRRLADAYLKALRALGEQAQAPDAGGYTPSDFPELDLSQEDLDALLGELADASEG